MNLFRSEEHVRRWQKFSTEDGIIPLQEVATLFSGNFFRRRLDPDYVSHIKGYIDEFLSVLVKQGPFWSPAPESRGR